MSDIELYPLTAVAALKCDARDCGRRWRSMPYEAQGFRSQDAAAAPAFAKGWRVYAGGRTRRTYCPNHGPKVSMPLLHGKEV